MYIYILMKNDKFQEKYNEVWNEVNNAIKTI